MKHLFSLLIFLALVPQALMAHTVYKSRDANGNLIFSDQPSSNSVAIEVELTPTYSAEPLSDSFNSNQQAPQTENIPYTLSILKPENDYTFTTDTQTIEINIAVTPALAKNDKVQLFLNGTPYGTPLASNQFTLGRLDRGAYQLKAVILDENHHIKAESKIITFYQRRTSILH